MITQGTHRPQSWRQQLSYHRKAGNLIHIRKFLYAVKPIFSQDQWIDPYQELKQEARSRGYRPEMIEKVYQLLNLLEEFMAIQYLSVRLVLKGGTAINLFCTDQFPRLSIDLDFNYIGAVDRETMQQEKPQIEAWVKKLVDECKSTLSIVLPFRKNEIEFLDQLQQYGEIRPDLISDDRAFCERVSMHPLLRWRVKQMR